MSEMSYKANRSRAAYYREWRKKNPDKVRKYQETYWEKKYQEKRAAMQNDSETEAKA